MRFFLILNLLFTTFLHTKEISLPVELYNPCEYVDLSAISITIEHAKTQEEQCWGLMQRETLPYDDGMLFYYSNPQRIRLWMFNCLIDLDAAFLDSCQVIRELRHLYCCPCKMDPCRPVEECCDLAKYPRNDPVIKYFSEQTIVSSFPASYALEMNLLWFQENGVRVGDVLDWNGNKGWIIRSLDISELHPCEEKPLAWILPKASPLSVWLPNSAYSLDIAFLDGELRIVSIGRIDGGNGISNYQKPVFYSTGPVKGMIIAQPGWFERRQIELNDEVNLEN